MSILDSAELLLQAKNYSGSGAWQDESGNGHHAQIGTGTPGTNDPLFKAHDGFQYVYLPNANNGDYIEDASPPASADIAVDDVATFAVWYRLNVSLAFNNLFGTRTTDKGVTLRSARSTSRQPSCFLDDGPTQVHIEADSQLGLDVWHHLVVTIDHSSGVDEMRMYVNGTAVTANPVDISAATGTYSASSLRFSASTTGSASGGDITYAEFYKDIATASEVSTAHSGGVGTGIVGLSNPVAVVDFSDTAMVSPSDTSFTDPQSNVYTINRSSGGLITTIIDRAQWLYTTDDYHQVADDAGIDFGASDSFTILAAIRPHVLTGGNHWIVEKRTAGHTDSIGWRMYVNSSSTVHLIHDGTIQVTDFKPAVTLRTLTSVGTVRDVATDDLEAFVDAVGGGPTEDTTTTTLANTGDLFIGANQFAGAPFEGAIMGFAIWRSALTDAQITVAHTLLIRPKSLLWTPGQAMRPLLVQ